MSAQKLVIPENMNPAYMKVRPLYQQDTVTIRFFGDVMMHTKQIETAATDDETHDFSTYYELMKEYLDDSDLNVANMEFALGGKPYSGYPSFSAPDSFATYLAETGFNIFLCANNHIFDKGRNGVLRTLGIYDILAESHGIQYTGAAADAERQQKSSPLIINIKGIRIAFINATYGTNSPRGEGWPKTNIISDIKELSRALETAGSEADCTVVLVHWGTEYSLKHSESQKEQAVWLAEKGADIIIGAHPHVVQDAETIEIGNRMIPVVYSLGNSVSNMSAENTQAGLMSTIKIVRHNNGDISILPLENRYTWCSRPGGYGNSYYVIPLTDYLDRKQVWKGGWDYDKMLSTYRRVSKMTGIKENTK
jgi:poly-gamma-glutamate synthesis protein (capsule biosynthesis protein)